MNEEKGWNTNSGSFVKRPGKGWIHSDISMQEGVTYNVKYVGCIGVNESMKSLSFETRTQVARESIRRVAECAKLLTLPRRNRKQNDEQLNRILSNSCNTQWTGMNVGLHINTQCLKVTQLECREFLFQHTMQNISFACGGDTDIQDFVAYVAKDDSNGRACYVFECADGLANNVITTIGQAFELRFKKFLNSIPNMKSTNQPTNITTNGSNTQNNSQAILKEHKPNVTGHNTNNFSSNNHADSHLNGSNGINKPNKIEVPVKKFNPAEPLHHHLLNTNNSNNVVTANNTNNDHTTKAVHMPTNSAGIGNGFPTNTKFDEKLEKMPWFHGLMTRENAEKLLIKDGDYLVRETNKADRQYVLSGRYKNECRHIFLVDPSGAVRTKDRVFDNICHLIKYHQDNNIPIISKDNELLLEHPVCKLN